MWEIGHVESVFRQRGLYNKDCIGRMPALIPGATHMSVPGAPQDSAASAGYDRLPAQDNRRF